MLLFSLFAYKRQTRKLHITIGMRCLLPSCLDKMTIEADRESDLRGRSLASSFFHSFHVVSIAFHVFPFILELFLPFLPIAIGSAIN